MDMKFKKQEFNPKYTIASLFIILFFVSFVDSYRLLGITCVITIIYSLAACKNKFSIRLILPVLPFVVLMLLPMVIRYLVNGTVDDADFTLMIVGKILISSIILGTIVSKHSALYLLDGILNIGLPPVFNRILALTFRYFHMINEDIEKGRKALISRGLRERKGLSSLSIFGEWVGGFFLKSSNHSDMVFDAMKSRGFQGETRNKKLKNKELIFMSSLLIVFLVAILVFDGKV